MVETKKLTLIRRAVDFLLKILSYTPNSFQWQPQYISVISMNSLKDIVLEDSEEWNNPDYRA
jgi:hypothetical protein